VEQALSGGAQTRGVVRVGGTVRRPWHARSDYVHALLLHLEAVGFDGAPRFLGTDDQGREVLSFLPGEVLLEPPHRLSDACLASCARLVREFHDATAGTPLAASGEVVCHGDLGPHNMVFEGDRAVGIIDWDEDVASGRRLVDFGHAVWCCADVCEEPVGVPQQARGVALMCQAYGWDDPAQVLYEIADRFRRARDSHAAAGRRGGVEVFQQMVDWMESNLPALTAAL
jgi:hypothetical protein